MAEKEAVFEVMMKTGGKRKFQGGASGLVTDSIPQGKKARKHSVDNKDDERRALTLSKANRKLDSQSATKCLKKSTCDNGNKVELSKKSKQSKEKTRHEPHAPDKKLVDHGNYKSKVRDLSSPSEHKPSVTDKKAALQVGAGSKQDKKGSVNNVKTPLTDRQKHKRFKLRMKRIGKRKPKKPETVPSKKEDPNVQVKEKITIPRGTAKSISNWKKLHKAIDKEREDTNTERMKQGKAPLRKPGADTRRNPKFGKLEAWKKGNKDLKESNVVEEKSPEIWFDDVDDIFLEKGTASKVETSSKNDKIELDPLVKPYAYKGETRVLGMDCEMVGVGDGNDDMLARVSIVNQYGEAVYDKFVQPRERVVDYRTFVSGVRPEDLQTGEDFMVVQKEVATMLKGRILVGHAIQNDLRVLYLDHPWKQIRDTSRYKLFRQLFHGRTPSLKKLTHKVMDVVVQEGEHNSIQDAQAAMRLYTMYRKRWEVEIKQKSHKRNSKPGKVKE